MMKKITSFALLACALLFLITISTASQDGAAVYKRTNTCKTYKRDVLGARWNTATCPCATAIASFDGSYGPVVGLVTFAQDTCGTVTTTGFFSKGFDNPSKNNYTFQIVDDCGNVKHDLGTLGATFTGEGTKAFVSKQTSFNLNCDQNGILLMKSAKSSSSKRNNYSSCPSNSTYTPNTKRQNPSNAYMRVLDNNQYYAETDINEI